MNSVERIMTALDTGRPDRLPVMELTIDPAVIHQISPESDLFDFVDEVDLDVVPFGITTDDRPREWVDRKNRIYRDKWGALQRITTEVIPVMVEPPRIETDEDLDEYEPPDGNDEYFIAQAREVVERFKGRRAICFVGEAVFAPQQYLRAGLENLMIDYATRPEFVERLARIGIDYHVTLYRRLIEEGVEVVLLGDDYAYKSGPFMSPAHFERYILPGLTEIVRAIKDAGGRVIKHTDGDIRKILDMIVSTGVDALGPLEPLPVMQMDRIRDEYDVAVVGNVDVDLLCRGSVTDVVDATRVLIERVSSGGGHILSSGNSIISAVRPENYLAMLETAREFGRFQ